MKQRDWLRLTARFGTIGFLVLLVAVFSASRWEVFPTLLNFLNILNQSAILGVISVGLTVCLVMGLFDLSIAAMATLGGYLVVRFLVAQGENPYIALSILGVLAGASAIGVVNGILVSYLGISAFIATLAMGSVITGVILGYSESRTIVTGIPDAFSVLGQGSNAGIPNAVLVMLVVAFVLWLLLEHTQAGRNLYAIGGNAEANCRPAHASAISAFPIRRRFSRPCPAHGAPCFPQARVPPGIWRSRSPCAEEPPLRRCGYVPRSRSAG